MACDIYILHVIMTSEAEGLFPFSCNSLIQLSYTCVYIYIYLLKGISCIRNRSTLSVNYDPSVLSPALVSPVLLWFLALTERGGRKKKYIALSDRFLESKGSTFASGGPTPPLSLIDMWNPSFWWSTNGSPCVYERCSLWSGDHFVEKQSFSQGSWEGLKKERGHSPPTLCTLVEGL